MTLGRALHRHSFWVIWVLGAAVRLAQILGSRPHPGRDMSELERTARSVILHGTLGNPYFSETGPGAHVAPIAPLILAALYAIFGIEGAGQIAQRFAGALAASAQYALLPAAAEALGLMRTVGIAAGLAGALLPYKGYIETVDAVWEQPYVALVCVLLFLHTICYWRDGGSALWQGLFWGLAILLSPAFILVFLAVLAYEYFSHARGKAVLTALVCAGLVQVPWVVRNWVELGGFVPVRSNFGLEFSLSNRPGARPLMEDNVSRGEFTQYHPSLNEAEARKLRGKGEIAYNRELFRTALVEVTRDPLRFLRLTGERIWLFWWWPSHRTGTMLVTLVFTVLGLLGLRKLPAGDARNLLGLILLAYPLTYYVIQIDRRYRYPIEWIFILGAAALVMGVRRLRWNSHDAV